jgi:hypothetical protein
MSQALPWFTGKITNVEDLPLTVITTTDEEGFLTADSTLYKLQLALKAELIGLRVLSPLGDFKLPHLTKPGAKSFSSVITLDSIELNKDQMIIKLGSEEKIILVNSPGIWTRNDLLDSFKYIIRKFNHLPSESGPVSPTSEGGDGSSARKTRQAFDLELNPWL